MTTSSLPVEAGRAAEAMTALLRAKPVQFMDLVRALPDVPYRSLLLAWGLVRERHKLLRTEEGHYFLPAQEG